MNTNKAAEAERMTTSFNQTYARLLMGAGGWRALAYPLTSLVANPGVLLKGLWRAKVLLCRERTGYLAFTPAEAFLKLFYYIQSECLSVYGLRGASSTMGGGNLPMRVFWYQSVAGLRVYRNLGGAATVLVAMVFYVLSHLLWLTTESASSGYVAITMVLVAISTNFIGNLFCKQNYNALAWAFSPLVVWALSTGNLMVAALLGAVIPIFSITAFFAFVLLAIYAAIITADPYWLLCLAPGVAFFGGCLLYAHMRALNELMASIKGLLGIIGATPAAVQLRRPSRMLSALIFTTLLTLFPITVCLREAALPIFNPLQTAGFAFIPVGWFFVNQTRIFRVADPQSILILFLAVSAAITAFSQDPWILACFWLVNSNVLIALLLFSQSMTNRELLDRLPDFKPFDIAPALVATERFLSKIPAGQKVLLACRDPEGRYNDLFIEHFPLSELLNYAAHRAGQAVLPDFYSVAYFPDRCLWGTELARVASNLDAGQVEFVIVPSAAVEKDGGIAAWAAAGLELIDRLDFASLGSDIEYLVASKCLDSGWSLFRKQDASPVDNWLD